ncbi:MAG: hypothetical protein OEZ30_09830 [Candidatus Aminicenantes bacterium]|nr:hypothetical protein [Candidatus Aminicenantes bacterium]MDH5715851.1 hypothetical protein [Candidatus Aminicenantes bacterium]
MTKVAIPLFGSRVSPRFDCAPDILLATVEGDKVIAKEKLTPLRLSHPIQLINHLIQRGVKVVICGAVDCFSARLMAQRGVRVIPWVAGEAEEALRLFMQSKLEPGIIPHPKGRRKWRFNARWGPGRWF